MVFSLRPQARRSLLQFRLGPRGRPGRRRGPAPYRPRVEQFEERTVPSVLISGAGKIASGVPYALNLTTDEAMNQWAINWGDGNTQTVSGNPSSLSHTYAGGTANYAISASARRTDGTTAAASVANPGQFIDTFVPAASNGGLQSDGFMVFGPDGNLYVSDYFGNAVLRYSGSTGAFLGVFVPGGSGGLSSPWGLRFSPDGNLCVASYDTNSILKYDGATGAFLGALVPSGAGGLVGPRDFCWGPDGNLYVAPDDGPKIRRYNGTTGAYLGVFGTAPDPYAYLTSVSFGPDGNLYASDWRFSRVLRFNGTTGAFMDYAVPSCYGGLRKAWGLTFGPDGDLYVASQDSHSALAYDVGTGSFLGSRTLGASLGLTWAVAPGPDGNLYVASGPIGGPGAPAYISRFTGPFTATANAQLPVTVLGTATSTQTTALTIPKSGAIVSSTLTVPTGGTIFDLSLKLNITAAHDESLRAWLVSPAGTQIALFNLKELSGANLTNTVLQDSARTPLGEGTAPYTGQFHNLTEDTVSQVMTAPPLGTFAGQNAAGNWTLQLSYNGRSGPNGQLVNWSLTIARDVSPLQASSARPGPTTATVTPKQIMPLLAEAAHRWQAAGIDSSRLAAVEVQVANLGGATLGQASGNTIRIDATAAGWGWFVDPTPGDDAEFTTPGDQGEQGRMDLLTVLAHELGHVLGFEHADTDGVMDTVLPPGVRRLPSAGTTVKDPTVAQLLPLPAMTPSSPLPAATPRHRGLASGGKLSASPNAAPGWFLDSRTDVRRRVATAAYDHVFASLGSGLLDEHFSGNLA
jgi:WD40 repeat protein